MSEPSEDAANKLPGMTLGQIIGLLLVIGAGVGVYQYLTSLRGPTSNGMSVREWLSQTNSFKGFDDPRLAEEVYAFGPDAAPAFIRAFHWATNSGAKEFEWFGLKKGKSSRPGDHRYNRVIQALVVLGRKYPEKVDPFFYELMGGAKRGNAIYLLGYMGERHFSFLTNLVTTNSADSMAALNGLQGMKTNAVNAVPLIVSEIESGRRDSRWYLNAALVLSTIGPDHPLTLSTMLDGLMSTNKYVHSWSSVGLKRLTNQYEQIRPYYVRLAGRPVGMTNGFDPGSRGSFNLKGLGVSPETGVPIITRRLNEWMDIERGVPRKHMTLYTARALSNYGAAASNGIPAVEAAMNELRALADPTNSSAIRKEAERSLRSFERLLRMIEP